MHFPTKEEAPDIDAQFLAKIENGTIDSLDGVMTPTTPGLVEKHSAVGVDMTRWWAYTPQNWSCPACMRTKSEIVRLNRNGALICRLVEHHDHIKDLLLASFRRQSSAKSVVVADATAESFAKRSEAMVSAYDNTIICDDCNGADGAAKRAVGTHADFSFSPDEIARIVVPKPNQPHEIDESVARQIWAENASTFALRLKIVDRIAKIAADDEHWFKPQSNKVHPTVIESTARSIAHVYGAFNGLEMLCGPKRTHNTKGISAWRRFHHSAGSTPTESEIAHVAKVSYSKLWQSVPDDWVCPCCKRKKTEIIRPSKQYPWTFAVSDKWAWHDGSSQRKGISVVCGDCVEVARKLIAETKATIRVETYVHTKVISIAELASAIVAQPNARHNVKNNVVDELLPTLVHRVRLATQDAEA